MKMIYQFRSKAGPDVIMLADLTQRIFTILQQPLETIGILRVEQLPSLINALETAILKDLEERADRKPIDQNASAEKPKMSDRLGQRAYPFLELMKQSQKQSEPIMWGV